MLTLSYSKVTKSSHFILGNRILLSLGVLYSAVPEMVVKWGKKKKQVLLFCKFSQTFLSTFVKSLLSDDLWC